MLLARVVVSSFAFLSVAGLLFGKTLVVDPGVSGTVVGFPVHPWSCVLLVLRLALFVVLFSWRCGVLFFVLSSLLALPRLSCLFVLVGVRGGFCFSFAFCLVTNVCVLRGGRSAACTSLRYLVSACPCLSVLPVSFVFLVLCACSLVHARARAWRLG